MRQAVAQAFKLAAAPGQAWTSTEIAAGLVAIGWVQSLGSSERHMLRHTLGNMVAAGELARVGTKRVPGVKRPVPLYAMAAQSNEWERAQALALTLQAWLR
jgi:hypothetical protein